MDIIYLISKFSESYTVSLNTVGGTLSVKKRTKAGRLESMHGTFCQVRTLQFSLLYSPVDLTRSDENFLSEMCDKILFLSTFAKR
jgi:hypothetical protein